MSTFPDPAAFPGAGAFRPVALIEKLKALECFRSKMLQQDVKIDVARMMDDRPYAFECIALAHASADASLRRLALQLFAHCAKDEHLVH